MKMIVAVALALMAVAAAAPAGEKVPEVVSQEDNRNPDGSYSRSFASDDGIFVQEEGQLKEVLNEDNKPQSVIVVRGSYTFPGVDGKPVEITYIADENGFQPQGESIPKN